AGTGASIPATVKTQGSYYGGAYLGGDPSNPSWQLDGEIQITASAMVRAAGGTLGVDLTHSVNVLIDPTKSPIGGYTFPKFGSTAEVDQQDQINLRWTKTGPIPQDILDLLPQGLHNGYLLEGTFQDVFVGGLEGQASAGVTVGLTIDSINSPIFSDKLIGEG